MAPIRLKIDYRGINADIIFGTNFSDNTDEIKTHVYIPNDNFIFGHRCQECSDDRNITPNCMCPIQHIYKMKPKPSPRELTYIQKGRDGTGTVGWYEYTYNINELSMNFIDFVEWILDPETEMHYRINSSKLLGTEMTEQDV